MIRRPAEEKNKQIMKRLTAILVAVVFVFGTAVIPAEIYGTESNTDEVTEFTEPATEPAAGEEEITAPENVDAAETDEAAAKPQEEVTEEPAEEEEGPSEEVIEELTEILTVDPDSLDENEYNGFMYKLKDNVTKTEVREMEDAIEEMDKSEGQEVEEVVDKEVYTADSIETIAEVTDPETIKIIEPNYAAKLAATNDTYYAADGWYLEMIKAPYVWDKGMFGDGVKVAVVDSGVYKNHPDFEGVDFKSDKNVVTGTTNVLDHIGHGTLVTGIIAAAYNNGKGLTGIMPEATIIPVKVSDGENIWIDDVTAGIQYAADQGAHVINVSIGTTWKSDIMEEVCDEAAAKGAIIVAAAGNEAEDATAFGKKNPIEYPAAFDSVISVGSVGKNGTHSWYSNYNKYVAVSAPGESIRCPYAYLDGSTYYVGYTLPSQSFGTSLSSPMVAAMAAMVKSMNPSVDNKDFMEIIRGSSVDKGTAGYDYYHGYGLMDLSKAYLYMKNDMSAHYVVLGCSSYVYTGTAKKPSVSVKHMKKTLTAGTDYTVSYAAGRTAVGSYNVTVTGKGEYTGKRTVSFRIVPPLIKAIKAPKRLKKKLTIRWGGMSKSQKKKYKNVITGYQVRVSTSSTFASAGYATVKGIAKTKVTVKGLKAKTTYYVQYRAYKRVGKSVYYSKWSSTKKAKTK